MPVSKLRTTRPILTTLALPLVSGCAIMGMTSVQTVPLEEPVLPEDIARVRIDSVSKQAGASREYPVGVSSGDYGFSEEDLANLRVSLEKTIKAATASSELHPEKEVRILFLVRSYVVAYTNHSLAMLAAFDWCAVREDDSAIYREIFYAPRSWNILGPSPGKEKDAITRAVVRRVGESALMFAAGSEPAGKMPRSIPGTYDTFDEAVATLPADMRSWGMVYFVASVPIVVGGSAPSVIPWQSVSSRAAVSCDAVMKNEYSG